MELRNLAGAAAGQTVRVRKICCAGSLRKRLPDIGMIPGTAVTCVHRGSGIAAYRVRGAVIALRLCDAAQIIIE